MKHRFEQVHVLNDALDITFMGTVCGRGYDISENITREKAEKLNYTGICKACTRGIKARLKDSKNYLKSKKWIAPE